MKADPLTLIILVVVLVALIAFIIIRNIIDKNNYLKDLNANNETSLLKNCEH